MCGKSKTYRGGLIYLISFVLLMSLASTAYSIGIGDFENDMDGWSVVDANTSTSFSTTGATLNQNSLRIEAATGYQQAISYDLIANNMVDEFRNNLKVSADVTRLVDEWTEVGDLWCDFFMVINAGSSAAGNEWDLWEELDQDAKWHATAGSEPINFVYNYSLTLPQIDFDNLEYLQIIFGTNYGGYDPGGVYYLDNVQMFGGGAAYVPSPLDGAKDVSTGASLSWMPGIYADKHDVYFGTNFNDINNASRIDDPNGVLVSQNQDANSYDPNGLDYGTTYFWRVDEVNDANIWKGDVWSFTTEYLDSGYVLGDWEDNLDGWYVWENNPATQSYSTTGATLNNKSLKLSVDVTGTFIWQFGIFMSPEEIQILKANDLFSIDATFVTSEWLGGGSWGQVRYLAINAEGIGWNQLDNPISDTSNPDAPGEWNPSSFGEIDTRTLTWDYSGIPVADIPATGGYCQFSIGTNHDAAFTNATYYFDNARLLNSGVPTKPNPANQQTDVQTEPTLSWTPGKYAETHDVYFGDNFEDVNAAIMDSHPNVTYVNIDVNSFKPGSLEFNSTYYWRVDEISNTDPDKTRRGDVWSFTTGNFLVIDDFEEYNDISNRIFDTWGDYYVNNTGMTVGHLEPPFAERRIVHGDYQSMYMRYDNDGTVNEGTEYEKSGTLTFSEAERQWAEPQDWTAYDAQSLTLWFRGIPASVGSFSVIPPIYLMNAGGADIWGTADQFHFGYKQFSGLGSITAKVLSVKNTDQWAKAGVMIRESLDADAKHVMMVVTPGGGVSLQDRPIQGGSSEELTVADVRPPQWVKLTRSGNTFIGEYSADGKSWQSAGSVTMSMLTDVYIGLCLTSHNVDATCTANFSSVSIDGTVTGDWQSQDIGIESNIAEPMYMVLQDNAGNSATLQYPESAATTINTWTQWSIPLTDFTGVDLQAVTKISIGVGDRADPQAGSAGTLYIDDIRLLLP
jgi:regulation of enolase protein 1 (concanavalin A-like superfamily)